MTNKTSVADYMAEIADGAAGVEVEILAEHSRYYQIDVDGKPEARVFLPAGQRTTRTFAPLSRGGHRIQVWMDK